MSDEKKNEEVVEETEAAQPAAEGEEAGAEKEQTLPLLVSAVSAEAMMELRQALRNIVTTDYFRNAVI